MGREKNVYSINENVVFLSIFILSILTAFYNTKYSVILIFFILLLLVNGNAKRIYFKEKRGTAKFIRRIFFIIPLYLTMLVKVTLKNTFTDVLLFSIIGGIFSILLILIRIRDWRISLSSDIIEMYPKEPANEYITRILYTVLTAIGEELFFRRLVIGYVVDTNCIVAICISTLLFFCVHFGTKWHERFSVYDLIIQIVFGIGSSILFIVSQSILPCIVAHLVYNFPTILLEFKRLINSKKKMS